MSKENKKESISEDVACENLSKNIAFIKSKFGYTQKSIAIKTNVTESTLSAIMKENRLPKVYFLLRLSDLSGYTIDQLLRSDLSALDSKMTSSSIVRKSREDITDTEKLIGLYQIYYYDDSRYPGHDNVPDSKALRFGLLLIYEDSSHNKLMAEFVLDLERDEMSSSFNHLNPEHNGNPNFDADRILKQMRKDSRRETYKGTVEFLDGFYQVHLSFNRKNSITILFYRPKGPHYFGGLGQMLLISTGRNRAPETQMLGISKYDLTVSNEELAQALLAAPDELTIDQEAIKNLAGLVAESGDKQYHSQTFPLTDVTREILITGMLKKIVTDCVYHNLFRVSKLLTEGADDDFCDFLRSNKK